MAAYAEDKSGIRQMYTGSLKTNLKRKKEQLAYMKRKISQARTAGRIEISEQLRNAEKLADRSLATAEVKFQQLCDAGDDTWEDLKLAVDIAWEDLSHSVRDLFARFS